ncbi:hypothetical protein HOLleu_00250 [Holothuria leucospilota]|uniref:TRP C-terminal domain-containing protein n=1 Tax=Holothuria leucospilota TaxID=206669 RepID=A0A9Q1CMR9_HOLLE|nr:hypothetical protein HOLleu_00250 [Holothuria leucospilota]
MSCDSTEHIARKSISIICVTPFYVPRIPVEDNVQRAMHGNGFICHRDGTCEPCARGTYGNGRDGCDTCPRGGYYQDEVGATVSQPGGLACKTCPTGTFVKDGRGREIADCKVCPDGTIKSLHAKFRACACIDGYVRTDRFGPCVICVEVGSNCSWKDYRTIRRGYFWSWEFAAANLSSYRKFAENLNQSRDFNQNTKYLMAIPRAYKCPRKKSCKTTDDGLEVVCAEGYTGWLCSKCERRFYSVINSCVKCPNLVYIVLEAVLIFGVCGLIYLLNVYRKKCARSSSKRERSFVYVLISRIKIALGFYQVVGELMVTLYNTNRRKTLYIFGEVISLLQVNVLKIFVRPRCISDKLEINPKAEFIIEASLPPVIVLFSLFVYFGKLKFAKLRAKFSMENQLIDSYRAKLKSKLESVVVISMFVIYPSMCTSVFQLYPWSCKTFYLDLENTTFINVLRSDFDISCNGLTVYLLAAYMLTVGYVVAFPGILFFYLRIWSSAFRNFPHGSHGIRPAKHQEENQTAQTSERNIAGYNVPQWVKFFSENYKSQYWFWEIVELIRKVAQTIFITLLGWESKLAVLLSIGTSVLFLTLHARYMPMRNKFEQGLQQMLSLFAIFTNLVMSAVNIPEEYDAVVSIILIPLNAAVIVIIAVELVLNIALALKQLKFDGCFTKAFQKTKRLMYNQ